MFRYAIPGLASLVEFMALFALLPAFGGQEFRNWWICTLSRADCGLVGSLSYALGATVGSVGVGVILSLAHHFLCNTVCDRFYWTHHRDLGKALVRATSDGLLRLTSTRGNEEWDGNPVHIRRRLKWAVFCSVYDALKKTSETMKGGEERRISNSHMMHMAGTVFVGTVVASSAT